MTIWGLAEADRFMLHVEPEPNSGCWLWVGADDGDGYGNFRSSKDATGVRATEKAHRSAWRIFCGPIPQSTCVLHACDVRCCVNPSHLFLGSKLDNNIDMAIKWRGSKSKNGLPFGVRANGRSERRPFIAYVPIPGGQKKMKYLGSFATAEEASAVAVAFKLSLYSSVNQVRR